DFTGLDRTREYYFAVVGVNRLGEFLPNVTPALWTDPLAGEINDTLVVGGPDELDIEVFSPVVVRDGGMLQIEPGATLRFAPGAGIVVEDGSLHAMGTALAPIHLTASDPEIGFDGLLLGPGS